MLSIYNYRTGVTRRSTILSALINTLAIAGWSIIVLLILAVLLGLDGELITFIWEVTE